MALLPYLQNTDETLERRALVAMMLHHLPDKQVALPLLFACLHDDAWRIRGIAVNKLGTRRWEDGQIVRQLVPCLHDPQAEVCCQAAAALGKLGDTRGVELLVARLQSAVPQSRVFAADALGNVVDARAVKALLACLQDMEPGVRATAVRSLSKVGNHTIIPDLLPHLYDPSWDVQIGVMELLSAWGDAQVVEPLLACLASERKWPTRKWICAALGKLGDQRAVDALIYCLHDQDGWYLEIPVVGASREHSGADQVRCAAATALGKLRDVRALDALSACLSDDDTEVRRAAVQALEQLRAS